MSGLLRQSRRTLPIRRMNAAEVLEDRTLMTAYVVDTLADTVAADGKVSLREAILAANGNAAVNEAAAGQGGGVTDTIGFAAPVSGGTIGLAGTELAVTDHLAIFGPVTVSGQWHSRVFSVAAGASVTLAGLTIQAGGGGFAEPQFRVEQGGGVYNAGALNLFGCVLTGNRAREGGGVFNADRALLAVFDCSLSNTSLGGASAIANRGVLTLTRSLLSGNAGGGALINHFGGKATVSGSVVYGTDGIGVSNAGVMTIEGGSLAFNTGYPAVNSDGGSLALTGVTVTRNGPGVFNHGGRLTVVGGRITENTDTGLRSAGGRTEVYGCVIYGNGSPRRSSTGGGVSNGGAGVLVLRDSIVSQNAGRVGGGVYNDRNGTATVSNCLIAGNGVSFTSVTPNPEDSAGGGIWNAGTLVLSDSVVSDNAAALDGGGIANGTFSALVVSNSVVTGNVAARDGGGIANLAEAGLLLADSVVSENSAATGGGVSVALSSRPVVITRSTLAFNTAADGGGIDDRGYLEIYNSTISGNYASGSGGGVRKAAGAQSQLLQSQLLNVTVFGNRAGASGGGISTAEFGLRLQNTLVAGNRRGPAGTTGSPDDVTGTVYGESRNNLIGDAATAGGLVNAINANVVGVDWRGVVDPLLRYNGGLTPTHALVVSRLNPAWDRGVNSPFPTDQRGAGFPRESGGAVDIGAYEIQAVAIEADEALAAFWEGAGEDEAFAGFLAAV